MPSEVERFPIQLAKVQPPVLRDETLERPRLIDWLRAKIHGRVVLLIADAGYGKTTLLADFSRRTRLRTLWYRLDDDDRDWVTLIAHLVASGREHDPAFAPRTVELLERTGVGGPGRDEVLDALIDELPAIATSGAMLILDDFHLVDDAIDARHIARELLQRAPERFTVVFASRRAPTVPLSRLRSVGDVAEIGTDDLRFDLAETTRLFNETYKRRLDPDVLADLAHRTEGWIASLQLVQAALRDRSQSEIRRFVRGLTGADQELYDYLAEEVVGDLPDELQRFLMETALLQVVTPDLAEVVTGLEAPAITRLTAAAEGMTLLGRMSGSPRTHRRYHPLVREFLETRLRQMDGPDAVAVRHRLVAAAATGVDWRIAAYHYREAADTAAMLDVIGAAIPGIMGNGQYALAESFIGGIDPALRPPRFDLILSRVDMQQGDYQAAISTSLAVLESGDSDPVQRDHALLNLITLYLNYGDGDRAMTYADQLRSSSDPNLAMIAEASAAMVTGSESDDIDRINRLLITMAKAQRTDRPHHYAVTQYNLALNLIAQDRPERAIAEIGPALEVLEAGSATIELNAARLVRASALSMLGDSSGALAAMDTAQTHGDGYQEDDVSVEIGELLDSYLDPEASLEYFAEIDLRRSIAPAALRLAVLSQALMLARRQQPISAERALTMFPPGRATHVGIGSSHKVVRAYVAVSAGSESAPNLASDAVEHARRQGAHKWRRIGEILLALTRPPGELGAQLRRAARESPQSLTFAAELVVARLAELEADAAEALLVPARQHPERWRHALRFAIDSRAASALASARLLELIGDSTDIRRLRALAHELRRRPGTSGLGRQLARKLAPRVVVLDQGRLTVRVGDRSVPGSAIRRKVLALICFLLTRPQMAGTRDQVLEALWPDLDPEVAVNSLNQTLYFLRRVFEESYDDDVSPEYVHHDSDVVWLDPELVTSGSVECRALIRGFTEDPTPDQVDRLVEMYEGRFALDFEYEEWAFGHRDTLHAAYLDIVERSLRDDIETGHHERGIRKARRVLEIDSTAEQIEVALLRLYQLVGAHAAAAEQYAHYASVMRDEYGIEPPPLDSL